MIRLVLFPILVLLIGAGGFALSQAETASTTRTRRSADAVQVRFGSPVVVIPCSCIKHRPESGTGNVRVSALVENDEPLNYRYAVTGGRIIGQGPNVIWDFNDGTDPGKYSVTIVVDNGVGTFSSAVTESMEVADALCDCPCVCPSMVVVSHKSQVKRGDKLDFEARVSGGTAMQIQYNWRVENGVITSGQGTPSIEVTASSERTADIVTANLEVGLDDDCDCPKVASQSVPIGPRSITRRFPASVTRLALDESTITLACRQAPGNPQDQASKDPIIDVETHADSNYLNDKLSYVYAVSGGSIIGSGRSVKWDITGLAPGTYTITASVDDGHGKSEEKRRTITIRGQDCGGHVNCPSVLLSTPRRVGLTNDFIVRASFSGGSFDEPQYVWEATGGEIMAGQGSKAVRVRASSINALAAGPLVNFTLEVPTEFSFCNQSSSVHLWIPTPQ